MSLELRMRQRLLKTDDGRQLMHLLDLQETQVVTANAVVEAAAILLREWLRTGETGEPRELIATNTRSFLASLEGPE